VQGACLLAPRFGRPRTSSSRGVRQIDAPYLAVDPGTETQFDCDISLGADPTENAYCRRNFEAPTGDGAPSAAKPSQPGSVARNHPYVAVLAKAFWQPCMSLDRLPEL